MLAARQTHLQSAHVDPLESHLTGKISCNFIKSNHVTTLSYRLPDMINVETTGTPGIKGASNAIMLDLAPRALSFVLVPTFVRGSDALPYNFRYLH